MRLSSLILKSVVTEKSTALNKLGRYVFEVAKETNTGSVKSEIKKLYGVDVIDVRTSILPGKPKRQGNKATFKKTPQRKRLILTLKEGQKIEL